ncbi:hypothetical protein [Methylotenera sp.]|uniref:hypothetical protein n=1 Tax=Methylotenera sp. TaxID=2051956 RepID=UPI002720F167|nr:hypothetical protein [Methylotenera sp.]MDO9204117.1 hypothetical protein [Methylotenera sp.]MDP2071719.1 hypothetical protein [Methylotenera sp.]MDP3006074.1 hypothetical protein [Methylotenera sp.]
MNSLQRYFLKEAIKAIQFSAGNLIKDGEIDAITLVSSMEEFLIYIKDAESKINSKIDFPFNLLEYQKRIDHNEVINQKPLFVKPRK